MPGGDIGEAGDPLGCLLELFELYLHPCIVGQAMSSAVRTPGKLHTVGPGQGRGELRLGSCLVAGEEPDDGRADERPAHRLVGVQPLGRKPLFVLGHTGGIEDFQEIMGRPEVALPAFEDAERSQVEASIPLAPFEAPVGQIADLLCLRQLAPGQVVRPEDDDRAEPLVADRVGDGEFEAALIVDGCGRTRMTLFGDGQIAALETEVDLIEVTCKVLGKARIQQTDGPAQMSLGLTEGTSSAGRGGRALIGMDSGRGPSCLLEVRRRALPSRSRRDRRHPRSEHRRTCRAPGDAATEVGARRPPLAAAHDGIDTNHRAPRGPRGRPARGVTRVVG